MKIWKKKFPRLNLALDRIAREKPSVSDSYPWLLQSLDEPEPANVSQIKTEPDRQTQEFCHSVCHPFASKPNLCRSQKPRDDGGRKHSQGERQVV